LKKVLITGASRGIGKSIFDILRTNNQYEIFSPLRSELDLNCSSSINKYFKKQNNFDILINNAGINIISKITEIEENIWNEMLNTNLTACLICTKHVLPHMQAQRWGRIINISSIFSIVSKENRASYSAIKAGLNGLTRTSAIEGGPFNILVNSICPGYVETELTFQNNSQDDLHKIIENIPLGRLAQPVEIANLVNFLISEKNTYITGQSLIIDGGFTLR
jgi:3-oxoacyl-[acyl-carrier protein] reductase